jgi:putative transposase
VNQLDTASGRQVWHNFRETRLTHQRSYLARLNYAHHNAVHHRLVPVAAQWRWCSAAAFERAVTPAWAKTIASFRYDDIARADGD